MFKISDIPIKNMSFNDFYGIIVKFAMATSSVKLGENSTIAIKKGSRFIKGNAKKINVVAYPSGTDPISLYFTVDGSKDPLIIEFNGEHVDVKDEAGSVISQEELSKLESGHLYCLRIVPSENTFIVTNVTKMIFEPATAPTNISNALG